VRVGGALCGLDGPHLRQLMHSVCQLTLVLFQLMLGLCHLLLYPHQLSRHAQHQRVPSLRQLVLSVSQFLLSLRQRMPTLDDDGLARRRPGSGGSGSFRRWMAGV
jgi:hypothetical protein